MCIRDSEGEAFSKTSGKLFELVKFKKMNPDSSPNRSQIEIEKIVFLFIEVLKL